MLLKRISQLETKLESQSSVSGLVTRAKLMPAGAHQCPAL